MTAAPKLCRECRFLDEVRHCLAPQNNVAPAPDYVHGDNPRIRPVWYGAQYCREDEKACGPDAKWWEPKQ